MANTYTLIASSTVGAGGAATISFSSIPSTYTDLVLKISARTNSGYYVDDLNLSYNGSSSNLTWRVVQGNGSAASSASGSTYRAGLTDGGTATSSTFGNTDIYIPNYAGSNYKSASADVVMETNATASLVELGATLWSQTAAINALSISSTGGNFVQYSTAYLYGVKNA